MSQALVEKRDRARILVSQGESYNRVVEILGVSKSSVSLWCRDVRRVVVENKLPEAKKSIAKIYSTRISDDTKSKMRQMCADGVRRQKIAELFEVHITTVQRICRGIVPDKKPVREKRELVGEKGQYPYQDWHLYFSKDKYGAKVVHLVHAHTRQRLGMRYARYLMSVHLKRVLTSNEIVRFKQGVDDNLDNLILTTLEVEMKSRCEERMRPCERCGTVFEAKRTSTKYCSNQCRWNSNDERKASSRACRSCGEHFSSESKSQRYCTPECKPKPVRKDRPPAKAKNVVKKVECCVCEAMFLPKTPDQDVCFSKSCNDLVNNSL